MKLLLDTCALLWLVGDRDQLSDAALEALSAQDAQLFVSAISAFEIAVKVRKGKLALTHACEVPLAHGDPADRMVVATAMLEGMSVVTPDHLISDCPGLSVVW